MYYDTTALGTHKMPDLLHNSEGIGQEHKAKVRNHKKGGLLVEGPVMGW